MATMAGPAREPGSPIDVQPFVAYATKGCHQIANQTLAKNRYYAMGCCPAAKLGPGRSARKNIRGVLSSIARRSNVVWLRLCTFAPLR
jgi:hypothetical protein